MKPFPCNPVPGVLLALVLLLPAGTLRGQGEGEPVLVYHRYSLELQSRDPTPRLRLYASGRALVYHPAVHREAGEYELWLDPGEVTRLLDLARSQGLDQTTSLQLALEADRGRPRQQRDTDLYTLRTDTTVTELTLRLDDRPLPPLVVDDLQWQARRAPGAVTLQSLAELERRLLEIAQRPDRVRIGDARPPDRGRP